MASWRSHGPTSVAAHHHDPAVLAIRPALGQPGPQRGAGRPASPSTGSTRRASASSDMRHAVALDEEVERVQLARFEGVLAGAEQVVAQRPTWRRRGGAPSTPLPMRTGELALLVRAQAGGRHGACRVQGMRAEVAIAGRRRSPAVPSTSGTTRRRWRSPCARHRRRCVVPAHPPHPELRAHAGQWALPGGRVDDGETRRGRRSTRARRGAGPGRAAAPRCWGCSTTTRRVRAS